MKPTMSHIPSILLAAFLALIGAGTAVAGEYFPDPTYNGGRYTYDHFGNNIDSLYNFVGRKSVRLSNGDIVIAGTVPPRMTDPDNYNENIRTIGLVRRDASGNRVAWSNPGSAAIGNDFVIRPALESARITAVKDMVALGNFIIVLAENWNGSNVHNTGIYVFGTDGSYKTGYTVDSASASERLVWGSGLAIHSPITFPAQDPTLIYIGRKKASTSANERIAFRRYTISGTGTPSPQTPLTLLENAFHCRPSTHCSASGIAWGGGNLAGGNHPRLYITGARQGNACPEPVCGFSQDAFVSQISPTDGSFIGEFMVFGDVSGNAVRGRGLAIRAGFGIPGGTDDIFVVSEVERQCKNGAVIHARLNVGGQQPSTGWHKYIGGYDSPGGACVITNRTTLPIAIEYQDGRVAAVGYSYFRPITFPTPTQEDTVDGFAVVLEAATGALVSPTTNASNPEPKLYRWSDAGESRIGHSGVHDVVASGNGSFTLVGDIRHPIDDDNYVFAGLQRFASLRIDERTDIFSDGFESSGGGNSGNPSQGLNAAGLSFFNKLFESQQTRTLVGHQATSIRGVGWEFWQCNNNCSDFYTSANNRHPAVVGWELESRSGNSSETLDWETYATTMQEALKARNRGAINTFAMHLRRLDTPGDNAGSWQVQPAGHCDQLLPGGTYHAQWNTKLAGFVTQLNTYQVNGQPVPFLFRPFHEADGNWFWWGSTGCSDTSFKNLFRYTVQYMRNAGLKHMLVVYAPGIFTTQAQYLARYPGDDVVDVIGFDQYLVGSLNPSHGTTVADLTNKLSIVHALAQSRGKIAAWAETGQQRLPSNDAFTQMAQAITNSGAKLAYIMFWANYTTSEFYVPYPSSPQALKTDFQNFLQAPRVTAGQYPSLYP